MGTEQEHDGQTFAEGLSEIRHDLRTPVGHIIGYSEMILEDLADDADRDFRDGLEKIRTSGERLKQLIDDLLGSDKTRPDQIDLAFTQHQLRIQLNHIAGYCEILQEAADEQNLAEVVPDLSKISTAAKNFTGLMESRLTPAAFESLTIEESAERSTTDEPSASESSVGSDDLSSSSLSEGGDLLIVDDDPANRELLQRRLQRQGYNAIALGDGSSALDFLSRERVDLLLLDMMMPGISGMEVLRQLKDDRSLRHIPVIMLSALDDVNQIVQSILMGAEDYIFKPYNPVLLKARIGACLEKVRLREQSVQNLKVFVSSPSDVQPERRIVKRVIHRLNEEFTGQLRLTPYLWEDEPLLGSETAQSQVLLPRETDIYVGIFWARMGTQLPEHIRREDGSRYGSGSEYEYEDALIGYRERGRPEILVYRKTTVPVVRLTDRDTVLDGLEQKERLESFLKTWFQSDTGEILATYHAFEAEDELENTLEEHLRKLLMKRLAGVES